MSTAFGNSDLQLMEKYDFKAPINTTVIIYDSDEDDKPSAEKEQHSNDVAKNKDNIMYDTFEYVCETTNETNQETTKKSKKRRTPRKSDNAKKNKIAENITKDNNTELLLQNQTEVSTMDHTANDIENKKILAEDQSSNSNQIATTTTQGSTERYPLVCTPQITLSQNEDDINKNANTCLKTLLDTVSTHLIFIMQAYVDYRVIASTTSDIAVLEIARKHYYNAKSQFFYLSFSAVSNIMLPKENDKAFMENFIENTIKLAHSKQIYLKHSDMTLLCADMFSWTKSHVQHPLLLELLNKEPQPTVLTSSINSYQIQGYSKETNADSTCLFRSGHAGSEFTISGNSTAVQNSQNTMLQFHNTSHAPMQTAPSRQSALPSRDESRNNANSRNYMQEFRNFNSRYDINSNQFPNYKYKSNRGSQIKKGQPKRNHHPVTPLPQASRLPPYYSTHNWHYETVMPQDHSENQIINSVNYNSFQVHQVQEEVNRSLSRDSGFMSPLSSAGSASNDQMCSSPRYDHHIVSSSTLVTPMITHVTSLNPSVAFIKDGICHVCGKLTKQKCLGCYKFYYCSHQCQIDDWKYHVFICK